MIADLSGINHFPKARRRSATRHHISFKNRWHCNPVLFYTITLGKFFPKASPKRFFETVFLLPFRGFSLWLSACFSPPFCGCYPMVSLYSIACSQTGFSKAFDHVFESEVLALICLLKVCRENSFLLCVSASVSCTPARLNACTGTPLPWLLEGENPFLSGLPCSAPLCRFGVPLWENKSEGF